MAITIRDAQPEDVRHIFRFICELAEYEKLRHEVVTDEAALQAALFAPSPKVFALIAEHDGAPAGFALYFYNFSTFLGRHGIYLEDLYISPEKRGKGIGKRVLAYLADKTLREGCGRLEWSVLDWNTPALDFYGAIGAAPMDEWTVQRLTGQALADLAQENTQG